MTIHTVYVRPAYAAEYIRSGMCPDVFCLEIGADEPHLSMLLRYKPRLRLTESQTAPRWRYSYDSANGRLARIDFRDDRLEPETAYDEIADALAWVRDCARALVLEKPWHSGLFTSSCMIAQDWFTREAPLREALKPPFLQMLV